MEIENNHHVLRGNPSVPNELINILDVEERSYFFQQSIAFGFNNASKFNGFQDTRNLNASAINTFSRLNSDIRKFSHWQRIIIIAITKRIFIEAKNWYNVTANPNNCCLRQNDVKQG